MVSARCPAPNARPPTRRRCHAKWSPRISTRMATRWSTRIAAAVTGPRRVRQIPGRWRRRLRCCAWIVAQDWCNGRIGTMGLSYAAHTQASLGCLDPPGLAAQILDSGGFSDSWNGGIRRGGAFELKQATWAFNQGRLAPETLADSVRAAAFAGEDLAAWFTRWPWKQGHSPAAACAGLRGLSVRAMAERHFRRLLAKARDLHARLVRPVCPRANRAHVVLVRSLPAHRDGELSRLRDAGRGPTWLILGPWTHGNRSETAFGETEFGPAATLDSWAGDWRTYRRRFFDRHLKGEPTAEEPAVRVFVMGGGSGGKDAAGRLLQGGRWITAADWPLPGTAFTAYHLHGDGSLATAMPEANAAPLAWTSDPAHPVHPSAAPLPRWSRYWPAAATTSGNGRHVRPRHPVPAAGQPAGRAGVSNRAARGRSGDRRAGGRPSLDRLGRAGHGHHGQADRRASGQRRLAAGFRAQSVRGHPALPLPRRSQRPVDAGAGSATPITVELFPTANLFRAGHRIRLDIASSEFPHYDVNPQSGEPEGAWRTMRVATNTVFLDAARPSAVVLPVIPAERGRWRPGCSAA